MQDQDYSTSFDVPFASGCLMALRTDLFRQIGGFDENIFLYAEDADLTQRVNQVSRTVYVPGAKVRHDWQRSSYRKFRMFSKHVRSLLYYFRKWGFRFA
jgi:GT2 family glycosyltransferase